MSTLLFPDFEPHHEEGNQDPKTLGCFYTDVQIADFLVWWAIRSAKDSVLDSSFGGGVFLRSACKRLLDLGGQPSSQVHGVEIDARVHARIAEKLHDEFDLKQQNLVLADFFSLDPAALDKVEAVVGNPPFVRYQRFRGATRQRALARCAARGVTLPELSSSWAPFVVCSVAMLRDKGRLAMVVPMEIAHARYALPVLRHLRSSFGKLTFLTFRKHLFPDLSEDTLLLLAEDKGAPCCEFRLRDLSHGGLLGAIQSRERPDALTTRRVDPATLCDGRERFTEYLIPRRARDLYRKLKDLPQTQRLGELADVGIGYVTGANEFFHLSPQEVDHWGIPKPFLRPAVRRGRMLSGLRFTTEDWDRALHTKGAGYLLKIDRNHNLPEGLRRYLKHGERQGVFKAYKCRMRSPWYRVPHVYMPDAFLSYMSGVTPRLVANDAKVVAPNTLHILRLHPHAGITSQALAALWQTSLVRLSVEIEGHALGGGMLKLEPTEAERVLLPSGQAVDPSSLTGLAEELDTLMRNDGNALAQTRADRAILQKCLGLSPDDCKLLQTGANILRNRRYSRSAAQ